MVLGILWRGKGDRLLFPFLRGAAMTGINAKNKITNSEGEIREGNSVQCPVCGSKDTKLAVVLSGLPPHCQHIEYNLYGCKSCDTLFYNPFPLENYAELIGKASDKFDIEYNAGLLFMSSLIYPLRECDIKSMLDIGCDLGFLIDIAKEKLGIERCIGIEPSYGRRIKVFDHEVVTGYFPDDMDEKQGHFNLIVSCEVLEHIHDPYKFLQDIIGSLSENGIAVLSTPNADAFFTEEYGDRIALASPGAHTILFSQQSLAMLLDKLGINYKVFFSEGKSGEKHIILYLSKNNYVLDQIDYFKPTSLEVIDFLDGYLSNKLEEIVMRKDLLYFGYLSRLIELRINKGEYRRCEKIIDKMIAGLKTFYKIDICDLKPESAGLNEDEFSFEQFMEHYPAFLGRFLYFYGIYVMNMKKDFVFACKIFKTALEVLRLEKRSPFFFANHEILKLAEDHKRLASRYNMLKHREGNRAVRYVGKIVKYCVQLFSSRFNVRTIGKAIVYLRNYGFKAFLQKVWDKLRRDFSYDKDYKSWIEWADLTTEELRVQRLIRFPNEPMVSVVVPTFNTPRRFLKEMVESVLNQTYPNWEICVTDGGSKEAHVREVLEEYAKKESRIKVKFLDENKGIAGNSNEALSMAEGEFVALLDHDDVLPPHALFEIVKAVNKNENADFIYSDEDMITEDGGTRLDPHFKPDWSPDMLRSYNYITHLSVFRRDLLEKAGCFRKGYEGSQDYDLILRATELAGRIVHIPKVLYHWRMSDTSAAGNPDVKLYAHESAKKALHDHLLRTELKGEVKDGPSLGYYRIAYKLEDNPKVFIIIPNRDHLNELRRCITSILDKSTYKNYEIIIVENGSRNRKTFDYYKELSMYGIVRIITWAGPFNYSAVNNFAVRQARGEILLFLNNDTEVINPDWIESMLEHSLRKSVGAVGAKLYYPNGRIQHAGVIVGIAEVAGHSHKYFLKDSFGYKGRLKIIQNLSAVTGACLMARKEVFEEVGGFEEGFTVSFNDVDLCLKMRQRGYYIVWTPYAELYHHESNTRGDDDSQEKMERFRKEAWLFHKKWKHIFEKGDPYYNHNLTHEREDFSINTAEIRN